MFWAGLEISDVALELEDELMDVLSFAEAILSRSLNCLAYQNKCFFALFIIITNLFLNRFDAELYAMSLPVLLNLCEILDTFFSHPSFVDLVFVLAYCAAHLVLRVKKNRAMTRETSVLT